MSSSNCCFLTCVQVSQEAGQVVWYSHLFQNSPQFMVIHSESWARKGRKKEERGVEGKGPEEMRKSWEVCFSREISRNCRAYWWFPSRDSFSILAFQKPTTRWPAATPSLCSPSSQSFQWPPINIEPPHIHIFVLPSHMWTTRKVPQILGRACNMKESPRELDRHPSQPEVRR